MKLFSFKRRSLLRRTFLAYLAISLLFFITPAAWTDPLRHIVLLPFSLAQRGVLRLTKATDRAVRRLGGARRNAKELELLRKRVTRLEAELQMAVHRRETAEAQLRQYTTLPATTRGDAVLACVTGFNPSPLRRTATFNKGRLAGVRRNSPLFWNGAAAGRVDSVGPGSCTAVLVGDRECRIAVRCVRTRVQGILEGMGGSLCRINYIGRTADVRVGDIFVTSGLDGIFPPFPPGYIVGRCTRATDETGEIHKWIELRPTCDLRRIETVAIMVRQGSETNGEE